jgi:DNA (cytosine-5)-methyltransferase 1
VVEPFLVQYHGSHQGREDGNGRVHSIRTPIPTLDTSNRYALVVPDLQPFLVKYNGTGGATSVEEPLDTVTAKDRFGLVEPRRIEGEMIGLLDVYFRMLQPHELAAAMSFPKSYVFVGNREQKVRQIGNAVAVNCAKALCKAILSSNEVK